MADLELKKSVESELTWEPRVNAAEIGVAVKDGIVTLSAHVQSYWENGMQNDGRRVWPA